MCEGNEKIVGDGTRRPYALEGNGYGLSLGLAYDNGRGVAKNEVNWDFNVF